MQGSFLDPVRFHWLSKSWQSQGWGVTTLSSQGWLSLYTHACACMCILHAASLFCVRYYAKDILDIISFIISPNLQTRLLSLREVV